MRDDYEKGLHDARLSIADFVLHIQRRCPPLARPAPIRSRRSTDAVVGMGV
jgi:hypothetical protein